MFLENIEGMTYIMALSPKYFSTNVVKIGIFSYITAEKSSNFIIFNIAAMLLLYIPTLSTDPLTSFMAFLTSSTGSSLGSGISLSFLWSRTGPQHFFAFGDMEYLKKIDPSLSFFNIKIYPIILCLSDISLCWNPHLECYTGDVMFS